MSERRKMVLEAAGKEAKDAVNEAYSIADYVEDEDDEAFQITQSGFNMMVAGAVDKLCVALKEGADDE